jgi:hypothetical protein
MKMKNSYSVFVHYQSSYIWNDHEINVVNPCLYVVGQHNLDMYLNSIALKMVRIAT